MGKTTGLSFVAAVSVVVSAASCIPDPKGDFDEYTDRTAPFRSSSRDGGSGVGDAAPPTQAEEGLYLGACLSTLAAFDTRKVLRFYTETIFTPDPTGGTGKLTLKLTPFKVGPNYTPPATVTRAETVGSTFTVDTTTNEKGVYAAAFGTVSIPGAANPISGRDILVQEAKLPGKFSKNRFCSQLIGHVVEPTDIQLEGDKNTCVYVQVKEGDPTPILKFEDFPDMCSLQ